LSERAAAVPQDLDVAAASPPAGRTGRRGVPGWFALAAGLLLLAVAVAFTWWALVPDTPVQAQDDLIASPGPSDDVLASADGAFAALCLAAGAVVAVALLWRGGRHLLRWSSVSLAGGALAAVVAWQLGRLMGPASVAAQQEAGVEVLHAPLDLSTPLVVLLWPAATACVLFVGLLVWLLVRPPSAD
jgi:hypothetical protein